MEDSVPPSRIFVNGVIGGTNGVTVRHVFCWNSLHRSELFCSLGQMFTPVLGCARIVLVITTLPLTCLASR